MTPQCFITCLVHVESRNKFRYHWPTCSGKSSEVFSYLVTSSLCIIESYYNLTHFFYRVRFHYGHPDIFDRIFHITRGGISKASKIINLSEDIFAGSEELFTNIKFAYLFVMANHGNIQGTIQHFVGVTSHTTSTSKQGKGVM